VTDDTLLAAVQSQARQLKYPWRYALVIFEPGETRTDLKPVWTQNSAALLGGNPYGPKTGAAAIAAAADRIARRGPQADVAALTVMVEVAARAPAAITLPICGKPLPTTQHWDRRPRGLTQRQLPTRPFKPP
jgi:hypothetical protein